MLEEIGMLLLVFGWMTLLAAGTRIAVRVAY